MIDFIKIYYRYKDSLESHILNPKNFNSVYTVFEWHTEEILYPYTVKLGSMDVGVSEKFGYVRNSLHKLFNYLKSEKEHNYNDFTYSQLFEMIDFILDNIVDAGSTKLTQLEFGINLKIEKKPEETIRRNFLMHKYKAGGTNNYRGKGELKQFGHSNYYFKIYDKGKQFELDDNIIRIEIKFIKAKEFQNLGIFYIQDLKDKENLKRLFEYLLNRFDELIIVDDFDEFKISDNKDYYKISRYSNPNFWNEEIKKWHGQRKSRLKKEFHRLLKKYDLLKTKTYLKQQLLQKFEYLINN